MKKIYHLSSCDTCKRVFKKLVPLDEVTFQDIKTQAITPEQLEKMKDLAGSYEALLNKRAQLYKERRLPVQTFSEDRIKEFILSHYTLLKRPVIIVDDEIFIGSSQKAVEAAKKALHG